MPVQNERIFPFPQTPQKNRQSVRTHQPLRNDPSENLVNGGVYKIRSDLMAHIVSPRLIIGILQYPSISLRLDGLERTLRWFTENSVGKNTQVLSCRRTTPLWPRCSVASYQSAKAVLWVIVIFGRLGTIAKDKARRQKYIFLCISGDADILCHVQTPYGNKNESAHSHPTSPTPPPRIIL